MEKVFSIPKISCNHCVMAIKNELQDLKGVTRVEGSAADKTITVQWEAPVTAEVIEKALRDINYPAAG